MVLPIPDTCFTRHIYILGCKSVELLNCCCFMWWNDVLKCCCLTKMMLFVVLECCFLLCWNVVVSFAEIKCCFYQNDVQLNVQYLPHEFSRGKDKPDGDGDGKISFPMSGDGDGDGDETETVSRARGWEGNTRLGNPHCQLDVGEKHAPLPKSRTQHRTFYAYLCCVCSLSFHSCCHV